MPLKFNANFTYVEKAGKLNLTSILPDSNEIFYFEGATIEIMKLMSDNKISIEKSLFEKELNLQIDQADWDSFINYCLDKNILKDE